MEILVVGVQSARPILFADLALNEPPFPLKFFPLLIAEVCQTQICSWWFEECVEDQFKLIFMEQLLAFWLHSPNSYYQGKLILLDK